MNRDAWRVSGTAANAAKTACSPVLLSTGTIVLGTKTVTLNQPATFTPHCELGYMGLRVKNSRTVLDYARPDVGFRASLPAFSSSTYPTAVAISVATVIVWMLFVTLFTSYRRRPFFIKAVTLVALVCITGISANFIHYCRGQFNAGYIHSEKILELSLASVAREVLLVVGNFMLLLAEVRTVVRIFPRKREKRLVFWLGSGLAVLAELLWLIDIISPSKPDDRNNSLDALIVFGYLFGIAAAILYSCCIGFYTFMKWSLVWRWSILPWTIICNMFSYLPIVLFILDLTDSNIDSWSDLATFGSIMIAIVSVWSWIDLVEHLDFSLQQESILGKQVHAEDRIYNTPDKAIQHSGYGEDGEQKDTVYTTVKKLASESSVIHEPTTLWEHVTGLVTGDRPASASTARTTYIAKSILRPSPAQNNQRNPPPPSSSTAEVLPPPQVHLTESPSSFRSLTPCPSSASNHLPDNNDANDLKRFVHPTRTNRR